MKDGTLLWIDARLNKAGISLLDEIDYQGRVFRVDGVTGVKDAVENRRPDIVLFDYDYADILGLRALQSVRYAFPDIPVLMLAEQHYENLSIWALRCRVWDYLIKPVDHSVLLERIELLRSNKHSLAGVTDWQHLSPPNRIPLEASIIGTSRNSSATRRAVSYIEAHLHEKISATDVSQQCGLSRYELSRVFKSELNMTFQAFLIDMRMSRAERMLSCTSASVTDIAIAVGFNDLSHFARKFSQVYGSSPAAYRRQCKNRDDVLVNGPGVD